MSVSQKTAARVSDAVSKLDQTVTDCCVGKRRGIPEAGLETVTGSKFLFPGSNTVCVLFLR